ncbi:hypothetical protein D3C81_1760750 [compost metagenome]
MPFGKAVVVLTFVKGGVILLAAGRGVLPQRFTEGILHPLRRLGEIGVHVSALKELDKLRQPGRIGGVFFVNVLAHLYHRRQRRNLFEGVVMFCGVSQGCAGVFQQIRFRAALLVVRVHHHARRRTAQVDARLQHQIPGRRQFTLLEA